VTLKSAIVLLLNCKRDVCISKTAGTRVRAMEYVRNLRERRGLTQAALADRCGCHATTVSQIESARMLPSLELFARLAQELKVSPSRLLDELRTAYQVARHASASVTNLQMEREKRSRQSQLDH
jgi:transcriptional regulator with XRE-family HTH domain